MAKRNQTSEHSSIGGEGSERSRMRALAAFGRGAITTDDLTSLLQECCRHVAEGLSVPIVSIALRNGNSNELVVKASVGLPPADQRGETVLPGGSGSAMAYAVKIGAPVVSEVATETRFQPSLVREGVKVSVNVALWLNGEPYGILQADGTKNWDVTEVEIAFLQSSADLLSAAMERNFANATLTTRLSERQVLLHELFHRIKNILANVQAIARRTAIHSTNLDEFLQSFQSRLAALSRAHNLLLTAPDQPVRLRELIDLEFKAKGIDQGRNCTIEGSDLLCEPRTIQMLALLISELATNAAKYGALSPVAGPNAGIRVTWGMSPDKKTVHFVWLERGVRMKEQTRQGFGSELIYRIVPQMLGGTAQLASHPDGIECTLRFPNPITAGSLACR